MNDSIYALATPPGRSAIAVMRVSGPGSASALTALVGSLPPARRASVRRLRTEVGETLDEAMVLWLPGPTSFTGEDSYELHLHGGAATVEAAAAALSRLGLRPAEPGEFSRRAFEAGKLSLTQAEAIADLVEAEGAAQRRQALAQLGGSLDARHSGWRESLVQILALLEAQVDFPDEDLPETLGRAEALILELSRELGEVEIDVRGRQVRDGFRVALIGAPNAGKSSLLNALAERDAAIVTPIPGTTRDVIEVPILLGAYKVVLADTAGLRDTTDPIEREGVRRARAWASDADLRILVLDASVALNAARIPELRPGDVATLSKSDLQVATSPADVLLAGFAGPIIASSTTSGEGLSALRNWLTTTLAERLSGAEFPAVTRERHRRAINAARQALADGLGILPSGAELAAEDVRRAVRALQSVSGAIDVEAVLDEVFSSFCVGK